MCGRRYISYLGPLLLPDNAWIGPRHINVRDSTFNGYSFRTRHRI